MILLAISVTMGLALWSYTNSNVNTSTLAFANTVTGYVNYLTDNFVPINVAFAYDTSTWQACKAPLVAGDCATVWLYNYGAKAVQINTVVMMKTTNAASISTFDLSKNVPPVTIPANSLGNVTIPYGKTTTFLHNGTSYTVQIITNNGMIQNYFQVDK
jgi:hypothetical protein